MAMLGFDQDEIDAACVDGTILDLDEELEQYNAACRLSGHQA